MARETRTTWESTRRAALTQMPAWSDLRTVPNALSVLRIFLIPVFLGAYLTGKTRWAAAVFALAAATDLIDGVLARLLKQRTALGAILDPLADKLLSVAALAALVAHGRLPVWLLLLSLMRDIVVLALAINARWEHIPKASPSRIGKYATFFTNVAVILALMGEIAYAREIASYVLVTAVIAGECLAVTAIQYAGRFAVSARSAGLG